jgi:hypothetical protein
MKDTFKIIFALVRQSAGKKDHPKICNKQQSEAQDVRVCDNIAILLWKRCMCVSVYVFVCQCVCIHLLVCECLSLCP